MTYFVTVVPPIMAARLYDLVNTWDSLGEEDQERFQAALKSFNITYNDVIRKKNG